MQPFLSTQAISSKCGRMRITIAKFTKVVIRSRNVHVDVFATTLFISPSTTLLPMFFNILRGTQLLLHPIPNFSTTWFTETHFHCRTYNQYLFQGILILSKNLKNLMKTSKKKHKTLLVDFKQKKFYC